MSKIRDGSRHRFFPSPPPAVTYIAFSNRTVFYKKFLYIKIIQ